MSRNGRTALFVIDMQNDFVLPGSAMYVAGAMDTIPAIQRLAALARSSGWDIFFIIREHDSSGSDVEPYRKKHFENGNKGFCVPGTFGCKIADGIPVTQQDTLLVKKRNSAFFNTGLNGMLQERGITRIVISGTQYPNCIRGTACDAMSFGYETTVCTDACSAKTEEVARANIFDMMNMGISCVPLSELEQSAANAGESRQASSCFSAENG